MEAISQKKEIVKQLLESDILISSDILDLLDKGDADADLFIQLREKIRSLSKEDLLVLNNDITQLLKKSLPEGINWKDYERSRVLFEKKKDDTLYQKFLGFLSSQPEERRQTEGEKENNIASDDIPTTDLVTEQHATLSNDRGVVKVVRSYNSDPIKRDVQHFVSHFNARYKRISSMLMARQELQSTTSISRVLNRKEQENTTIIGIVSEINTTKNGNVMITLEDPTGSIKAIVNKGKKDIYDVSRNVVADDIIGISGVNKQGVIFVNNVILPDIPFSKEFKKSPDEAYALFISDVHVGSCDFLPDKFERFLKWLSGQVGNEAQREIARKVRYLFVIGDLVDGVGIYPGQEKELDIPDIYKQYEKFAEYMQQIPDNISIIICPGNHDAVRIAEPQPPFTEEVREILSTIKNATIVSNPAVVNIHSSEKFPGFDVLMYHGYSFDYYVANVDDIRRNGGYDRADLIMKFLLQRRHLAPSHTSTLYIPDPEKDALVIDQVPDIFCTGHIHKSSVSHYRGITLISGSCWQKTTPFQMKVGHHPEPARVPAVNLKTREVKILKF